MPDLEFTLRMRVETEEEAKLLYDAVYSGYAAELIRLGVLYGHLGFGGGVIPSPSPSAAQVHTASRDRDAGPALTKVDNIAATAVKPPESESAPKPKKGLAGRKRIGRV